MLYVFDRAVSPAEAAGGHTPNGMTVKAPVMRIVILLQSLCAAIRADAALIKPVAVGIQAVLDVLVVYGDAQFSA